MTTALERRSEVQLRAIGTNDEPEPMFEIIHPLLPQSPAAKELQHGIRELRRLASAYELLADCPREAREKLFRLLGRRPYLFERNTSRWPDGRYRLVDRGYEPFGGFEMTLDELELLGATAWHATKWRQLGFTDRCVALTDDAFAKARDADGLRLLAALLRRIVRHVTARGEEGEASQGLTKARNRPGKALEPAGGAMGA